VCAEAWCSTWKAYTHTHYTYLWERWQLILTANQLLPIPRGWQLRAKLLAVGVLSNYLSELRFGNKMAAFLIQQTPLCQALTQRNNGSCGFRCTQSLLAMDFCCYRPQWVRAPCVIIVRYLRDFKHSWGYHYPLIASPFVHCSCDNKSETHMRNVFV